MNQTGTTRPGPRTIRWWWIVLACSVPAALQAMSRASEWSSSPRDVSLAKELLRTVVPWYLWALCTPGVIRLVRRVPIARSALRPALTFHAFAAVAVGSGYYLASTLAIACLEGFPSAATFLGELPRKLPVVFASSSILYAAVAAVISSVDTADRLRTQSLRAARLEAQLAQVRLAALQAQLSPHFLFNSLNAVCALIRKDSPERALGMVQSLSDLLRQMLRAHRQALIPLAEECRMLDLYLGIEQERWGSRLQVQQEIAPSLEGLLVPTLILQPLVENALKHAVARSSSPCLVRISARRDGDLLELEVSDSGAGLPSEVHDGTGLANTRQRLKELYGDAATVVLGNGTQGGARVAVRLPWQWIPEESASHD